MIIGFGNNVVSSLAADITASQTTIQVMPGAGAMFANLLTSDYANSSNPLKTYAKITLTDAKETVFEVCHLTAVNNDMLTVIRGQEGTTAKGWSLNDVIANFATRGSENQFVQIEELQSGHYVAGVAGGTENNLTLELPATYFVNGGVDWTLRTPLVVIPALNNTGASTLQLTMGGRVLGKFPLYKGNKAELSANDIIKDAPVLCVLDNTKTYFSVLNPLEIYLGSRYLQKNQNLSDVPDKAKGRSSLEVYSKTESDENYMAKSQCGADIPNKPLFVQNIGLGNVLFKGDGRFLAGTFVSDAIDRTSIGARAATGCQFMRAHQAPDAPDQVSFWQIITLSEVVSPTTVVDVLAVSGNNVLFGHGTGAGITSWRNVAMLEGAAFTGDISAPNMRCDTTVTVGDGTGGIVKGGVDGAGFNGNNLNIKSWNGIGFQCSSDDVIRAYISTKLGIIAASESVYAGSANLYKNGDVYGDKWSTGNGANWLSLYLEQLDSQIRNNLTSWTSNNFPTKADVSVALSGKPGRQYIKEVGVYQNDKTKPFMLHDDGSGVFLATTDMLSGYVQSIRFGAVEHGNLYRSPGFADQLGYVITGVENGDSNDTPDRIQRRLLQLKVNGQWYTVGT
ncbi:hypothetical protein BSW71_23430 [Salmonella enterica subsp. enterica serovar Enteritidis]|nr:hypothetical protein [Salmonella enterica subsp. enterica serovar Enteritidis]